MKRPRLYYQEAPDGDCVPRLRIIWPDGHCQYLLDKDDWTWSTPCWAEQDFYEPEDGYFGKCSSGARAIELMNRYDVDQAWPPAELIGEL